MARTRFTAPTAAPIPLFISKSRVVGGDRRLGRDGDRVAYARVERQRPPDADQPLVRLRNDRLDKVTVLNTREQVEEYLAAQSDPKRGDMQELHHVILKMRPGCKLWFLDGKDEQGKVVSNPNIGYGQRTIRYADGRTKDFYQIGMSANTAGISIYILGLEDKAYLAKTYSERIGKASVTGYCIKFKKLEDIDSHVLVAALQDGFEQTSIEQE